MKTKYKSHLLSKRMLLISIPLLIFGALSFTPVSAQTTATSAGGSGRTEITKIVVLSDIHLGADDRFNEMHKNKPALANLLKQIKNSNNIAELVIAGDLMDQWVMPMDYELPVSLSDYNDMIVKNNKEIVDGINAIIKQGNVRVTYVPGNHDMLFNATEAQRIFPGINQARDAEGLGTYMPTSQIAIEHGHRYNIYCAPDPYSNSNLTGGHSILPSGYFYARIGISSFLEGRPKGADTLPALDPKGMDKTQLSYYNYYLFWKNSLMDFTLKESFSDRVIKTGIDGYTQTFSVNDLVPYMDPKGKIKVNLFNNSVENWAKRQAINKVPVPIDTDTALNNGALATFTDEQAQNQYFNRDTNMKVVIFGHSHAAKLVTEKNLNGQDVIYGNSGTWIDHNGNSPTRTYMTIERDSASSIMTVNYKQFNMDGTNTFLDSDQISSNTQIGYEEAYHIGLQAYTYGLPLLVTNKTFLNMTRDGSDSVNQFNHVRSFNDSNSKAVVAPGASGLSSTAWLDLADEPQVLHIPKVVDHYFVMALIDPYTENLFNLGSGQATPPGDYVICGPAHHEINLPPGLNQIKVDYNRIWIIGSTQVKGVNDIPNVNKIQDGFTLTPLSHFGTTYRPPVIEQSNPTAENNVIPTGLAFFDTLCQLLQQFPPPETDKKQLETFERVGIGPGLVPSQDKRLNPEIVKGLTEAAAAGPGKIKADIKAVYEASAKKHNGYLLGGFGAYGTNYQLRGVTATIGLGAFSSDQTIFALTQTDQSMKPLSGSNSYVMHMVEAPPAREGWSITVYDTKGMLIQNPINRYQFNDLSTINRNSDGSIDIFFQAFEPADAKEAQNWLPIKEGEGFQVIIRLIAPEKDKINGILEGTGWQPPALEISNTFLDCYGSLEDK